MSYLVLARKYRPQNFEDLVGQMAVSQTLQNALSSGRIAHAYIFSGPRGVGKTTTARLLAKCLNCEKGPSVTPCNKCDSCVSIAQGNSLQDVLEIDGASNRGIEQIRELRENAKYTPAASRYRIYIIDEAHQITKDAFGALLKTLEEPPAHVVFMMATTEVQKIPAPILSRCQRFSLRPISPELVLNHLKEICKQEKIKVEDAALADIVRFVEGSLRDALSLLDQAIVFAPKGITSTTLRDLLGLLPREVIRATARLIQASDPAQILRHVDESIQNGLDLTQLGKDLQEYFHTLLLVKAGVKDVFQTDVDQLKSDAAGVEFAFLERSIRLLARMLEDMRRSENPRAVFEVALLRLAQKLLDPRAIVERLEKLESHRHSGESRNPIYPQKTNPVDPGVRRGDEVRPPPAPSASIGVTAERKPNLEQNQTPAEVKPITQESSLSDSQILAAWPAFVTEVAELKVSLGAALEEASVRAQPNLIIATFPKTFNQQMVDRSQAALRPLMDRHFGSAVKLETRLGAAPAPSSEPAPSTPAPQRFAPPPPASERDEEPTMEIVAPESAGDDVKKALKFFQGTVKKEKKPA